MSISAFMIYNFTISIMLAKNLTKKNSNINVKLNYKDRKGMNDLHKKFAARKHFYKTIHAVFMSL